jgi:lamin tail-like protein
VKIHGALLLGSLPLFTAAACSIYDSSLLGSGGSTSTSGPTTGPGSTTGATTSSGTTTSAATTGSGMGGDTSTGVGGDMTTGTGGAKPCATAAECPGTDTECKTRTCTGGTCGVDFASDGKALATQTAKDCLQAVCDGAGATKSIPDGNDKPDDTNDCTDDTCVAGMPTFTPKAVGTGCAMSGGKKCNAMSTCVECVVNGDCASGVCDLLANKCAPAGCGDNVKNGTETDLDCGGATCPKCATGKVCSAGTDCVGGACTGNVCAPSCTDGLKNNGESDVDCGGPTCNKCLIGGACSVNTDCGTSNCAGNVCYQNHLVINEIDYDQIGTDADEFVEIYNGTGNPVALTNLALVFIDGSNSGTYLSINLGPGTLPAGGYLVVGSATVPVPAPSIKITTAAAIQNGAPDGVALVDLTAGQTALIDALSYEGSITMANITGFGVASIVEGTPFAGSDSNIKNGSLSRLPNGSDTNNAASDWAFSNTLTPGAANVP